MPQNGMSIIVNIPPLQRQKMHECVLTTLMEGAGNRGLS